MTYVFSLTSHTFKPLVCCHVVWIYDLILFSETLVLLFPRSCFSRSLVSFTWWFHHYTTYGFTQCIVFVDAISSHFYFLENTFTFTDFQERSLLYNTNLLLNASRNKANGVRSTQTETTSFLLSTCWFSVILSQILYPIRWRFIQRHQLFRNW